VNGCDELERRKLIASSCSPRRHVALLFMELHVCLPPEFIIFFSHAPQLSCFRNKYLLLNSQELNELSAISHKANIPEVDAVVNTDR